jgi:replicative DNA helicase
MSNLAILRTPPHSFETEQALLGTLLLRPGAIAEITDSISRDSFYSDKHKFVYDALSELFRKSDPIDAVSVSQTLTQQGLLSAIGGNNYLAELTASVPSSSNLDYYARIVSDKAALRNLITVGDTLNQLGFDQGRDIEEILDDAEKLLFQVTQSPKQTSYETMKDLVPKSWETIERLIAADGEVRGVKTGFSTLDLKLSGLQNSDLIILAARPSMGKTALALDIARNAAVKNNAHVGFFSLEMSSEQLVDRMLSAESMVDLWKIRNPKQLGEDDRDKLMDGMSRLSKASLLIDDEATKTVNGIRASARRMKASKGLDLIVVDYLQLIHTTKNYDSMVNQVTEISRSLKSLARELEVPVLALSQLSRAVEARGGKPKLSDLRDSGAIEQDADVVMFIHREQKEEGGGRQLQAEILIEKHRNGPTGVAKVYFDEQRASFLDIDQSDFSALDSF